MQLPAWDLATYLASQGLADVVDVLVGGADHEDVGIACDVLQVWQSHDVVAQLNAWQVLLVHMLLVDQVGEIASLHMQCWRL